MLRFNLLKFVIEVLTCVACALIPQQKLASVSFVTFTTLRKLVWHNVTEYYMQSKVFKNCRHKLLFLKAILCFYGVTGFEYWKNRFLISFPRASRWKHLNLSTPPNRFHKIRIDPQTSLIHRDDFTFADTIGNHVRYGRAGDCYSAASKCHRGRFQVDLTGTGLRVRSDIDWEPWGSPKIPQRILKYRKSPDGTLVYGECGGSCGGCQPKNEKLYLEPTKCAAGKEDGTSS